MHPPRVRVEHDQATGVLYFQFRSVIRARTDCTQLGSVTGRYDVLYARSADGWLIRSRIERTVLRVARESLEDQQAAGMVRSRARGGWGGRRGGPGRANLHR